VVYQLFTSTDFLLGGDYLKPSTYTIPSNINTFLL